MKRRLSSSSLEVLESRIAPATIFIGAYSTDPNGTGDGPPDNPQDTEYRELNPQPGQKLFVDIAAARLSGDAIAAAVDTVGATDNIFYLRLSKGDVVKTFTQSNGYQPLITVTQGNIIAFFTNYNSANPGYAGGLDFDPNELTGLALGKNAKVNIAGNVRGDIVTNLDEHGTKDIADDTISMTGVVSDKQNIASLNVTGGSIYRDAMPDGTPLVYANVLSGGAINAISIAGTVGSVLAGSAINGLHGVGAGTAFDFFPDRTDPFTLVTQLQPAGEGIATFLPDPGVKGASISKVNIRSLFDRVEAGSGGLGAKGGDLKSVQITADTDGFSLYAGYGGAEAAAGKNGGAGGAVSSIFIAGNGDLTPNSKINIAAGFGGGGPGANKGGQGGAVSKIFVGFELNNNVVVSSGDLLQDSVAISAGNGGDGKNGGAGGSASSVTVRLQTPDEVQNPVDDVENEISLIAGNGGNNLVDGGKAGKGGSITKPDIRNQLLPDVNALAFDSSTLIAAGDGGLTTGASSGAPGGSILNPTALGFGLQLLAGDGSSGKSGGKGGDVKNTLIVRDDAILTRNLVLDAGKGGDGSAGKAGNGGQINKVTALSIDIANCLINSGVQGDGGNSLTSKGGNGGALSGINLTDTDSGQGQSGTLGARSGKGGNGATGGGKGGAITNANVASLDTNVTLAASAGGDSTGNGRGGAGGTITRMQLNGDGQVAGFDAAGVVLGGNGGIGLGKGGTGGAGGTIKLVNMNMRGDASLVAGNGGSGQVVNGTLGAAPGKGGSVISSGVFATGTFGLDGAGVLRAGDAGTDGAKPASGGSILGTASGQFSGNGVIAGLRALSDLTIQAGNGSHGGAGGSIRGIAYGSTAASLTPTPFGNILVQAGNGSGEGKFAGKGGSLAAIFGSVSSGTGATTTFLAGTGGSAPNKAADGGSISSLLLSLGGEDNLLTMQAGDGGSTASGKSGGKGGSVSGVGITNLDPLTNFRSVIAGNGGDGAQKGGNGGNISGVDVQAHDIGVRTGQVFGFDTMGGLFAGVGGIGASKNGTNGSVSNVTADSIAAIVAGRTLTPQLARSVSGIVLNDDNLLLTRNHALIPGPSNTYVDATYDPAYYAIANLVGAVVDLTLPGAWMFHYTDNNGNGTFEPGDTPIDGLVMAEFFDQRGINFIPEARFTTVAPSGSTAGFFDNDDIV